MRLFVLSLQRSKWAQCFVAARMYCNYIRTILYINSFKLLSRSSSLNYFINRTTDTYTESFFVRPDYKSPALFLRKYAACLLSNTVKSTNYESKQFWKYVNRKTRLSIYYVRISIVCTARICAFGCFLLYRNEKRYTTNHSNVVFRRWKTTFDQSISLRETNMSKLKDANFYLTISMASKKKKKDIRCIYI